MTTHPHPNALPLATLVFLLAGCGSDGADMLAPTDGTTRADTTGAVASTSDGPKGDDTIATTGDIDATTGDIDATTAGESDGTTAGNSAATTGSDTGQTGDTSSTETTDATSTGDEPTSESVCGDGQLDADELCDDGNARNDDACSDRCVPPGVLEWDWMDPDILGGVYGLASDEAGNVLAAGSWIILTSDPMLPFLRGFDPSGTSTTSIDLLAYDGGSLWSVQYLGNGEYWAAGRTDDTLGWIHRVSPWGSSDIEVPSVSGISAFAPHDLGTFIVEYDVLSLIDDTGLPILEVPQGWTTDMVIDAAGTIVVLGSEGIGGATEIRFYDTQGQSAGTDVTLDFSLETDLAALPGGGFVAVGRVDDMTGAVRVFDAAHDEVLSVNLPGLLPHVVVELDGDLIVAGLTNVQVVDNFLLVGHPGLVRLGPAGVVESTATLPTTPEYPLGAIYTVTATEDGRVVVGGIRSEGDGSFSGTIEHPFVAQLAD